MHLKLIWLTLQKKQVASARASDQKAVDKALLSNIKQVPDLREYLPKHIQSPQRRQTPRDEVVGIRPDACGKSDPGFKRCGSIKLLMDQIGVQMQSSDTAHYVSWLELLRLV